MTKFAMLAGTVVLPPLAVITTLPAGSFFETLYGLTTSGADVTFSVFFDAAAETLRPAFLVLDDVFMCRFLFLNFANSHPPSLPKLQRAGMRIDGICQ
jgi:hypothetical protein